MTDREIHVRAMRRALWGTTRPEADRERDVTPAQPTPPRDAAQTERR